VGEVTDTRHGVFVVLVGPDGVGKTSVARALCELAEPSTAYFHFRPPVLRSMAPAPPDVSAPPPAKAPLTGSHLLGWLRLARNLVWFWAAYLVTVLPALRAGRLVVGDRWAYGYLVQPFALKYYGPAWLAFLVVRLFPRPDLVANLSAPPEVIRRRKQELSAQQIEAELGAWSVLPAQLRTYDAGGAPEEAARAILEDVCP
jgi:hypothetical protein